MAAPEASSPSGRSRLHWRWGALALLAITLLVAAQPAWHLRLRESWFDALQAFAPRTPRTSPVAIVAIDEPSLAALGQWPWPRSVLADLVARIAEQQPAVIGIVALMSEPDRLSPARLLEHLGARDAELAARLAALPGNDQILAEALADAPVVLAAAGAASGASGRLHAAPVLVSGPSAAPEHARLPRYQAAITNLEALDQAAAGHGVISAEPTGAVHRRFPLVFDIQGTLAPAFAVELLRVRDGLPALRLAMQGSEVRALAIGQLVVPTEADGSLRVHYAREPRPPLVSAADVLAGQSNPDLLRDRIVLIGTTALGLGDRSATPLGELSPGVDIHAQLIENLIERSWLERPSWALTVELTIVIGLGLALVWATPRWPPGHAALLAAACVAAAAGGSLAAYRAQGQLFDATPAVYLLLLFGLMAMLALAEAAARRRTLERAIQLQREREAFVTGELDAARRIQAGMLPSEAALREERRIELAATMQPAREVGGDLYDFFLLDQQHLYFMVGDVSGKGVAASLFMAVAKSLCKSVALRDPGATPQALMSSASAEIGRDNAESLFVTAFIGKLDLRTGELACCNAGHDDPLLLPADGSAPRRLACDGGPPLCAVDGFTYTGEVHRLRPDDMLCLVSDGITEARDGGGALFGSSRLTGVLARLQTAQVDPKSLVAGLRAELDRFVGQAEPADDLTVLVIRWRGPGAA